MFHKIVLLLIALQISFISCYANESDMAQELKQLISKISSENHENNMSIEDEMMLLSKNLSEKRVTPINIQAIDQDNYLLYERDAPLNHMASKNANKTETHCIVKHISGDGVSKNINTLNNVELFHITKMYKVDKNKYVAVGYEQDLTKDSTHQAVAMLIDETGKTLWKTIVGRGKSYSEAVVQTHSGEYVVVGHDFVWENSDKDSGNYHVMVAKVDQQGERLWTKHYSLDGRFAKGRNIEKTQDDGFIIIGETLYKAWIFKIDALGNKVWETFLDTSKTADRAYSIADNHQDGYIVTGLSNGTYPENDKAWIIKINYSGEIDLNIPVSLPEPFMIQTVNQINANKFMLTGFYPGAISNSSFFMKIDSDGKKVSEKIVKLKQ
ncbi:MAG: hypothetical protein GQ531_11765 [Sulfurovum sp.]|nr:hypothetical protein [Sulfurovum sp.]